MQTNRSEFLRIGHSGVRWCMGYRSPLETHHRWEKDIAHQVSSSYAETAFVPLLAAFRLLLCAALDLQWRSTLHCKYRVEKSYSTSDTRKCAKPPGKREVSYVISLTWWSSAFSESYLPASLLISGKLPGNTREFPHDGWPSQLPVVT